MSPRRREPEEEDHIEDESRPPMLPASSCATSDERIEYIETTVRRMSETQHEIKVALLGSKYGQIGVFPRLDKVEAKVDAHDRKLLVWGAGLATLWSFIMTFGDKLKKLF